MYALTNVTMSSNYNVSDMVNDGMRTLSLDELDFISGGIWTWGGLRNAMILGGFAGGMAGAMTGPGISIGIMSGGLIGGGTYLLGTYLR